MSTSNLKLNLMGPGITRCYLYMSMTFWSCPMTLSQSLMGLQVNSDSERG